MTGMYRTPEVYSTFVCDMCGKPGVKTTRNQKRHATQECRAAYFKRKTALIAWKGKKTNGKT